MAYGHGRGRGSERRSSDWRTQWHWPTAAVGIVGLGTLGSGVVAALTLEGTAGTIALIATGSALVVAAVFGQRLAEMSFGSSGVTVKLVHDVQMAAGADAARKLDDAGLAEFADAYALIQQELQPHADFAPARVYLQDQLVVRAANVAMRVRLHPDEVRAMFRNGSPVLRVLSLGLMQGDPFLADFDCIMSAIATARTPNEQYQGLCLARQLWNRLAPAQRRVVLDAIERDREIPTSTDRRRVAGDILQLANDHRSDGAARRRTSGPNPPTTGAPATE